jgi:hypothetical protein
MASTIPLEDIQRDAPPAENGDAQAATRLRKVVLGLQPRDIATLTSAMCTPSHKNQVTPSCYIQSDGTGVKAITFTPSVEDNSHGAKPVEITVKGPETIAITAPDDRPFYTFGADAHWASEVAASVDSLLTGANVLKDQPGNPKQLVDDLLAETKRTGQPLGDIVVASHGGDGSIQMGNKQFDLASPEFLSQFARLRGHIATGAKIVFDGCSIAGDARGMIPIQLLADSTGTTVRGYKYPQIALSIEGNGPYYEATPTLSGMRVRPAS